MYIIFLLAFMWFVLSYDVAVSRQATQTLVQTQLIIIVNRLKIHSRSFYFLRLSFVSFLLVTYLSFWGHCKTAARRKGEAHGQWVLIKVTEDCASLV